MDAILTADSIKKTYGGIIAVDSISFSVCRREILGFLGPNGAGKTTTIRMLSGLLRPDGGEVRIDFRKARGSIGLCPQNIVVWDNLSCVEQLVYMGQMQGMGSKDAIGRSAELLESLGLTEKRDRLAKTLSGGMRRRLNIALALVHSPEIAFLDEPQAGLDPQSRLLVREYIRSIKGETTIVLTTHDMEEAEKLSDRICIIDRGKIIASGTTDEIKAARGIEDLLEVEIEGDIERELLPFLRGVSLGHRSPSPNSALFRIESPATTIDEILGVVKERDIKLLGLRFRKTSLEDIFIELTGRSLRE